MRVGGAGMQCAWRVCHCAIDSLRGLNCKTSELLALMRLPTSLLEEVLYEMLVLPPRMSVKGMFDECQVSAVRVSNQV